MERNVFDERPVSYLQNLYALLRKEYEYEKEQFKQQTERFGIERKVRRGMCWYPLRLKGNYYNSLNQLVVEVEREEGRGDEHLFEYGKPVSFFVRPLFGDLRYLNFVATVSYVEEDRMVIVLPNTDALLALQGDEKIGVQLYFDEISYRTMFDALKQVISAKKSRLADLRDIFHGVQRPAVFSLFPMRFPWLNPTQEAAVNKVLCAKDVAVVHGPPGTGKTTTLVEAIYETLHRETQVLVCAQSNMAVDWISEMLVDRGVNVLRIGNPSRVNDKMLSFTYERRFESHPDYHQLWSIRKAIRGLYDGLRKGHGRDAIRTKINTLKDRASEIEVRINESLFSEARVVACTLVGSANYLLYGKKFGTLFIDEAAQALEAACWIPIRKADRVILAGDHCQLPPTIKSPEALKDGLGRTLMQCIVKHHPEVVSMLTVQYRMNDAIMQFSSDWFYGGMLQSAPAVKCRGILDFDTPIEWVNTEELAGKEELMTESGSRINTEEAEFAVGTLKNYILRIGKQRFFDEGFDVGLISPYKAQVRYLRQLLKRDSFFKPFRSSITIDTVDGFQGQERDIILISLVRANEEGTIGFLSDLRRMNVAITRARMKLIILGDRSTLTKHPFYRRLYEYITRISEK